MHRFINNAGVAQASFAQPVARTAVQLVPRFVAQTAGEMASRTIAWFAVGAVANTVRNLIATRGRMLRSVLVRMFVPLFAPLFALGVLSGCAATDGIGAWVGETREAVAVRLSSTTVNDTTQGQYDEAVAVLRAGDAKQAEFMFVALSEEFPDLSGPHVNLALIRIADDRLELAEESARKAVNLNSRSAPANNTLGIVLRRQGKFALAEKAYKNAIDANPDYALAWRNLGVLYDLYLQRPHAALTAYRNFQALVAEPDREVAMWISDLSMRHGEAPRTAAANKP